MSYTEAINYLHKWADNKCVRYQGTDRAQCIELEKNRVLDSFNPNYNKSPYKDVRDAFIKVGTKEPDNAIMQRALKVEADRIAAVRQLEAEEAANTPGFIQQTFSDMGDFMTSLKNRYFPKSKQSKTASDPNQFQFGR